MKFYDMGSRKTITVSDDKVSYIKKKTKRGNVRMATANGPKGNKVYKIVGRS